MLINYNIDDITDNEIDSLLSKIFDNTIYDILDHYYKNDMNKFNKLFNKLILKSNHNCYIYYIIDNKYYNNNQKKQIIDYLINIDDIQNTCISELKYNINNKNIFNFIFDNKLLDINIVFDYIYSLIDRCSKNTMIWFYEIDNGASLTYCLYNYIIDNNIDYLYIKMLDHEEVIDMFIFMIKKNLPYYIDKLEIFDIYKYVNINILRTIEKKYLNKYDYDFIKNIIIYYNKIDKYFFNDTNYITKLLDFIEINYENIDVDIYIFYRYLSYNKKYIDDKYIILKEYLEEYNFLIKIVNDFTSNKLPNDIIKLIIDYL